MTEEIEWSPAARERRRRVARCCPVFDPRALRPCASPLSNIRAVAAASAISAFWLDAVAFLSFLLAFVMPPAGIPPARALPSKESSLFKEVLHYYEDRQLKKGLKAADSILKKFPNHGGMSCLK